ncbi:MAG: TolC family protein [Myxococcales bacterium]|nr:TolC family protein [Myxococcales bacterium]
MTSTPRIATLLIPLLWTFASPSHAEPLGRKQVLERAMRDNPKVAAARAREAGAQARARQVDAARYPELSLSLGAGPGLKASLVDGTAARSQESAYRVALDDISVVVGSQLEVVQPLYTFGKLDRRDRATTHDLRARQAQTRMARVEVALEAARMYEGLLFARDAALFFEDMERQLDETIVATQERLARGEPDSSEAELLQLQSAKSAARLGLSQSRAARESASAGLRAFLGLADNDAALELADEELAPVGGAPGDLAEHLRQAAVHRPELRALSEAASALDALAQAHQADGLPDLFALGFVSAAYTPGRDLVRSRYIVDPQQHFVPGVLVGLRWRWQAGRAEARASERRAEASELARTHDWALAGIPAEVQRAYQQAARARDDIAEAAKAVEVAKRWVVMVLADYTMGLAHSAALVDALEAYAGMRVSHLDAQYRYNIAMAELAAATGTLDAGAGGLYPGPASSPAPDSEGSQDVTTAP